MIEEKMPRTADYWAAYERWKKVKGINGITASDRLTREQTHERGC